MLAGGIDQFLAYHSYHWLEKVNNPLQQIRNPPGFDMGAVLYTHVIPSRPSLVFRSSGYFPLNSVFYTVVTSSRWWSGPPRPYLILYLINLSPNPANVELMPLRFFVGLVWDEVLLSLGDFPPERGSDISMTVIFILWRGVAAMYYLFPPDCGLPPYLKVFPTLPCSKSLSFDPSCPVMDTLLIIPFPELQNASPSI